MSPRGGKTQAAWQQAKRVLVGGVNSPVRSFGAVGEVPVFVASGRGSRVTDLDGNEYIDYVGGYGPAILGHAAETITTALSKTVVRGTCFGAPTEVETRLAEMVVAAIDSVEKVRFVNSGTEAVMTAVRLARGATGRNRIVKCVGCYHGHSDALLVSAGSGAATLGVPSSPGVPGGATADTAAVPYNDAQAVERVLREHGGEVAAVLVEPVAGNMGVVPPGEGYLQALRKLCDREGALLIFDEVMTGFRVAYGGAQSLYGVRPDLTTLGKVIGGGMPVGAVAGPAELLDQLAPVGPIYQAGTLSGSPPAMAAGQATVQALQDEEVYRTLEARSAKLEAGLVEASADAGLTGKVTFNRVGSMLSVFFTPGPVRDYDTAAAVDKDAFVAWFQSMLGSGVLLPPSPFEAMFVSAAHSEEDITRTVQAAVTAFQAAAEACGTAE